MAKYDMSIPVISAIIERERNGSIEILVQTRYKPDKDPKYSGTLEIAAGKIEPYENVYDAVRREVLEETGLRVISICPEDKTDVHSPSNDGAFAFKPYCCQQQIKNGKPWIGFVFKCKVEDLEPVEQESETRDVHWMNKSELEKIFKETPEKIFTLQLGVLEYYFSDK